MKEDEKNEILDSYGEELNALVALDEADQIDFQTKIKDTARSAKVFGRSVLAFEPGSEIVPRALKPVNARELGRVFVHQLDWSLSSVRAFTKGELIKANEMIYVVNMQNTPLRRAMHYGFSEIQRVVGEARALLKIYEFEAAETAGSLLAGYGLITVDTEGKTEADAKAELTTIANGLKPGAFNLINGKKDEVTFQSLDLEPRLRELVELADKYERLIIGNSSIPGPLVGREEEANMATLFGKIRLFTKGPVKQDRDWLGKTVAKQWYEHNLRLMQPSVLEHIKVEAEFEPMIIESWADNIDALLKLKQLVPTLPDDEILRLADLEELTNKLDANMPLNTPSNKDALGVISQQTEDKDLKDKVDKIQQTVSAIKKRV